MLDMAINPENCQRGPEDRERRERRTQKGKEAIKEALVVE